MNFTKKKIIPFQDFGGKGKLLHFAHANAYPPGCYKQLIQPFLSAYKVFGMEQRPLWENSQPETFKNWDQLADDFLTFIDQQGNPKGIIGMGHSMGGVVTILAAIKRPKLFSKIILIDPVIFPRRFNFINQLLPINIRKRLVPIAKISAKRKDLWDNQQMVFDSFRSKKVFKNFSDESLWDLVKAGTKKNEVGQITLTYPKAWETQIYITAPYLFKQLKQLKVPIIAVKGEYSNVISTSIWDDWKAVQPRNKFIEFPNSGHLVPMEYPKELAACILEKLAKKDD